MGITYCTLIQVSQTPRPSTAILVLVGLLVLGALALAVYLYRYFKRSDRETAEEDWRQARHTLMLESDQPSPPPGSTSASGDRAKATEILVSPPKFGSAEQPKKTTEIFLGPEPQAAAERTQELRSSTLTESKAPSILDELRATTVSGAEMSPKPESVDFEQTTPANKEGAKHTVESEPPASHPAGRVAESQPPAQFPLGNEIWEELEAKQAMRSAELFDRTSASVTPPPPIASLRGSDKPPQISPSPERTAPRPTQPEGTPQREPFEPPRIEPIVPRKLAPDKAIISASARPLKSAQVPMSGLVESFGQQKTPQVEIPYASPPRVTAEVARPRATKFDSAVAVVEPPATRGIKTMPEPKGPPVGAGVKKPGSSVLGLPSEPSDKPLILGQAPGSIEVETLSSYGKTPKEVGGHGGTNFLAVVLGVIGLAIAGYLFVPGIHGSVNGWVARVRGTDVADQTPKARIFTGTPDNTQTPIKIGGSVQNVSTDTLSGLKVVVSLQAITPGAPAGTVESPVIPDQVAPAQQGTFQFDLDPKMYKGFRIAGLKAGDGKDVPYTTPEQSNVPPGLAPTVMPSPQ